MSNNRWTYLLAVVCLLVLLGNAPAAAQTADPDVAGVTEGFSQPAVMPNDASDRAAFEQRILELVNQARAANGVAPLLRHASLNLAAERHGLDMANNNFVGHTGTDGSRVGARVVAAGYNNWIYAGENVAAGFSSPDGVFQAWMNSEGHRRNMLDPGFHEIGIAYVFDAADEHNVQLPGGVIGGPYFHYWVEDFGARSDDGFSNPTATPVPPTATPTRTPTYTPVPPTATPTRRPPTATPTRTRVPPTSTPTWTSVPRTATPTWTRVLPSPTPTDTPVSLTNGTINIHNGAAFVNTADVTLDVNVPDYATQLFLANEPTPSVAVAASVATSVTWQLQAGESGSRTVYAWYTDALGRQSPVFSTQVVLDQEAPEGGALAMKLGKDTYRLLALAEDSLSGVAAMRWGEDSDLTQVPWSDYEREFTVKSAEGSLHVQFMDAAGNVSPVYNVLILSSRLQTPGSRSSSQ